MKTSTISLRMLYEFVANIKHSTVVQFYESNGYHHFQNETHSVYTSQWLSAFRHESIKKDVSDQKYF